MRNSTILATLVLFVFMAGAVYSAEAAKPLPQTKEGSAVKVSPKKVEVDSNFDGKIDRTEIYDESGQISRVEIDSNGDGKIDEWIIYKDGKPVQDQRDSNGDGKVDVWIEY